jgi:hypothetical protein
MHRIRPADRALLNQQPTPSAGYCPPMLFLF